MSNKQAQSNIKRTWRQRLSRFRDKGFVVPYSAIILPILLGVTGLVMDGGRVYMLHANLAAAVDAAAFAAVKAVANGEAAGTAAAQKYFQVNIPSHHRDSHPKLTGVNFAYGEGGNIEVNITAEANMPTTFLQLLGIVDIDMGAKAQAIRRPVDLALAVDNTTSLRLGAIGDVTQDVIDQSKNFVDKFNENFDRLALIKYAFGAEVPVPLNMARGFDKAQVQTSIDAFTFGSTSSPQFTNSAEGFWQALDQIRDANEPASLRVIVFFTDGAPNTFASQFAFSTGADQIGAIRSGDGSSGTPQGLWRHNLVAEAITSPVFHGRNIAGRLDGLPRYYNPHDPNDREFQVLDPSHPRRPVTDLTSNSRSEVYQKVNRISRNLLERMAEKARQEGIYVLTLGLGSRLTEATGPDDEQGEDILLRMANDPRMQDNPSLAGEFKPSQPHGVYCHAVNKEALAPCFGEMLALIIRLTQ